MIDGILYSGYFLSAFFASFAHSTYVKRKRNWLDLAWKLSFGSSTSQRTISSDNTMFCDKPSTSSYWLHLFVLLMVHWQQGHTRGSHTRVNNVPYKLWFALVDIVSSCSPFSPKSYKSDPILLTSEARYWFGLRMTTGSGDDHEMYGRFPLCSGRLSLLMHATSFSVYRKLLHLKST